MHTSNARMDVLIILLLVILAILTLPTPFAGASIPVSTGDLSNPDQSIRDRAIKVILSQLDSSPRATITDIQRQRLLEPALEAKEYNAVAEITLRCVNGQPDRLDRVVYYLNLRIRALLAAGRPTEALAAAKSFYNVGTISDTPRAIDLICQSLAAAHPDDPTIVRRFKFQQLTSAATQPARVDLGPSVLAGIKIDPAIYDGKIILQEPNPSWQKIGQANLLLLTDRASEARPIFESLLQDADSAVADAAVESIARVIKAQSGFAGPANTYLESATRSASR